MTPSTAAFIEGVVEAAPSLRHVFDEHSSDYDGDVLPHLFMQDVTRWVLEQARRPRFPSEVQSLLDFFESSLEPEEDVRSEFPAFDIAASGLLGHEFFSDLAGWRGRRVALHLGPKSKREWRAFHPWPRRRPGRASP